MEELGSSAEEALSIVPDAIRYTFQYREAHYTQGVWADMERLKGQGFELDKLRNTWAGDQYKGINSQWTEPESSQRFEVQFHTRISYEAKQLTHTAYERLRDPSVDEFEKMVLKAFQRKYPRRSQSRLARLIFPTTYRGANMTDQGHLLRCRERPQYP